MTLISIKFAKNKSFSFNQYFILSLKFDTLKSKKTETLNRSLNAEKCINNVVDVSGKYQRILNVAESLITTVKAFIQN